MFPDPSIAVNVTADVATPMIGAPYSLTCTVTGAESFTDAVAIYQWSGNGEILSNETMATLSFQSLAISDAGRYACQATVTSSLLSAPIFTNSINVVDVTLSCK